MDDFRVCKIINVFNNKKNEIKIICQFKNTLKGQKLMKEFEINKKYQTY